MLVPKLRFKEFTDEWKIDKLYNNASFLQGLTYSPNDVDDNDGVLVLRSSNIKNSRIDYNDKVFVKLDIPTKLKIKENDILMCVRNGSKKLVGKTALLTVNDVDYTWGAFMNVIRSKNNNHFIYHYFNSSNFQQHIYKDLATATVNQITLKTLNECKINIPSLNEQNKISNFLTALDKKIELQTKKIETLKLYKKGLINKFFSDKNLTQIIISDIGEIITGTTPSKENKNYWNNANIVWITPSDINYNRDIDNSVFKITQEGLKNGRFVPKNAVLVTCIASIGKNAILKVDGSCNQQINAIVTNKDYNYNYVYYLMEYISKYLKSIAGTSATSIINKEAFKKIQVKVHSLDMQDKIDNLFSKIEIKIILERHIMNELKFLKKGLMQNMFV